MYGPVFRRTEFLITASCDGHIKFWKRQDEGVEFVKHFKAHMGEIIANFHGSVFHFLNNILIELINIIIMTVIN